MNDPLEALADAITKPGLATKFLPAANGIDDSLTVRIRNYPHLGETIRLIDNEFVDSFDVYLGSIDETATVAAIIRYRMATPERLVAYFRANLPQGATP